MSRLIHHRNIRHCIANTREFSCGRFLQRGVGAGAVGRGAGGPWGVLREGGEVSEVAKR